MQSTAGRTQKASLPVGEEVASYRGTDIRVVHRLPGKPAAEGMSFTDPQVSDLHKGGWFPLTNQQVALFWSEGQGANIHGSTAWVKRGLLEQECTIARQQPS